MKNIYIFTLFLLFHINLFSQEITFNFNFENAKQTLILLEKKNLNEHELEKFANLKGSQSLIKKINENDSFIINAIKDANQKVFDEKHRNFQYESISKDIEKWSEFIKLIEEKQSYIETELTKSFKQYLSPNKEHQFNIFFLLGGYSSGFTLGDGSNFYIGVHHYQQDLESILLTCKHELFHNIQKLLYNPEPAYSKLQKKGKSYADAYEMLYYLLQEGSASYIASEINFYENPNSDKSQHQHIKELYKHIIVNKYRISSLNVLINSTILDLYKNNEKTDKSIAYELLFDWNWNNPAYYAGEKMTEALVNAKGKEVLKEYLIKDPIYFISDYIALSKNNKEKYPIQFTSDFANMVNEIKTVIEK